MNELKTPELRNPQHTAEALHVSVGTLAIWRCRKRYPLRYVKMGRKVFYRLSDINAFIEKRLR
jgi:hypothetical protein